MVVLGTGDWKYENMIKSVEERHPNKFRAILAFSSDLASKLYGASDMFLMPSKFEPCGLSQLIAMRYGSVPVVRETGGLKDTVQPYNRFTGEGNGFSFRNFDAWEMRDTIRNALGCYYNEEIMHGLINHAMQTNFSFDLSAEEYARHYIWML